MSHPDNETVTSTTMDPSDDEDSYVDVVDLVPRKTVSLTLTPKNKSIGMNSNETSALICATMVARPLSKDYVRTAVDIVVALDLSTSMIGGDKLELCKRTIELLLRNLLPQDRFGLITYSDDAVIKEPMQLMTNENKKRVLATVKDLHAYGHTNISAAISLSFQELQSVQKPNKVRSIFLLTDGHANLGITNQADLSKLTLNCWEDSKNLKTTEEEEDEDYGQEKKSASDTKGFFGSFFPKSEPNVVSFDKCKTVTMTEKDVTPTSPISLLCFGYGSDHNATMLRDISDATETGSYYFVETDGDVSSAFGDALGGLVSIVAQSAVLTLISPSDDVQIERVHHERAILGTSTTTPNTGGTTYTVSLGDFYAEESRDVLIEVTLSKKTSDENEPTTMVPHLLASLSYTDMLKKMPFRSPKNVVCMIERPFNDQVSIDDEYVAKQWIRVYATNEMKEAEKLAQMGKLNEAQARLQSVKDCTAKADTNVQNDEMIRQLILDMDTAMKGFVSVHEYNTVGSKNLTSHQQTYKRQRMSGANSLLQSPYRTSFKQTMAQKFHDGAAYTK